MKKLIFVLASALLLCTVAFGTETKEASKKKNLSLLVSITGYIDGAKDLKNIVKNELETLLAEKGFQIVKTAKADCLTEKNLASVYAAPPEIAADTGKKCGANAVITGMATSNFVNTSLPYGKEVYTYQARIEVRVINTKTGHVLAMNKAIGVARASTKPLAASKSLANTARGLSGNLARKIIDRWRPEICEPAVFKIICNNSTPENAVLLKKEILQFSYVKGVRDISSSDNVLTLEVIYIGTAYELVKLLEQLLEPVLDVKTNTQHEIYAEFIKAPIDKS